MRLLLGLAALVFLPACIRSDLTLDFVDAETVVARSAVEVPAPMFDILGVGPDRICGQGKALETEAGVTCHGVRRNAIDEVAAGRIDFGGFGGVVDVTGIVTTERLSRERIRVSVDMAALVRAVRMADPTRLGALSAIPASLVTREGLVLRIRGGEIVGTTGRLSDDGSEARIFIRAARFREAEPDFGGPFITLLKFSDDCLLGVFCD